MADKWAQVEGLANRFYEVNRRVLEMAHSNGVISDEDYEACLAQGNEFAPACWISSDLLVAPKGDESDGNLSVKRILVSHEEAVNEAIEKVLSSAGYEAKTTTHPSEVLGLVREFAPDFALIKLVAPEIDGLDLSEQLAARFPKVKVVLLGPFFDLKWTETYLQDRGISCKFLDAPFGRNELLDVMES